MNELEKQHHNTFEELKQIDENGNYEISDHLVEVTEVVEGGSNLQKSTLKIAKEQKKLEGGDDE